MCRLQQRSALLAGALCIGNALLILRIVSNSFDSKPETFILELNLTLQLLVLGHNLVRTLSQSLHAFPSVVDLH